MRTLLADLVNSLPDFSAIFNLEQFALWQFMGSADFTMYSLPAIREYISVLQQNDLSRERHGAFTLIELQQVTNPFWFECVTQSLALHKL